jgi:flagellar hook assembly protein FlgD
LSYANNQIIVPFFVAEEAAVVSASEEAADIQSEVYNFPNPVRDFTNFQINLGNNYSETENIQINIYDLKGQMVKSISANNNNGQGSFSQSWNAADESGNALSAGIYFYKVIAQDNSGKVNSISARSNIQVVR